MTDSFVIVGRAMRVILRSRGSYSVNFVVNHAEQLSREPCRELFSG